MKNRSAGINRRGSVLLHVMVTGLLVAIISAALMRMAMFRFRMAQHGAGAMQAKRAGQGGMAALFAYWAVNQSCTDPNGTAANSYFKCTGVSAGNCGCTCKNFPYDPGVALGTVLPVTIQAVGPNGGPCQLLISAPMP